MKSEAYFNINPDGLMRLVRDAYYFEDKKKWVKDVTKSLNLPWEYMEKILSGDGIITYNDNKKLMYVEKEDNKWKEKLQEHLNFEEKNYIVFAGRKVERELVEEYAGSVVGRLRDVMRHPELAGYMDTISLYDLEIKREEMHKAILKLAGFEEEDDDSDERFKFNRELAKYLDEKAGSLINPNSINLDDDYENSLEYLEEKKKAEKAGKLNPPKYYR